MIIYLIGMPGSGKSAVGRELARSLARDFVDLDDVIEETAGITIPEIFSEEGEPAFRRREAEALQQIIEAEGDCVLACGGGTPCYFDNLEQMKSSGKVVFLKTDLPALIQRLENEKDHRPLLQGDYRERLARLLTERTPVYEQAHYIVETDGRDPSELVPIIRSEIQAKGK